MVVKSSLYYWLTAVFFAAGLGYYALQSGWLIIQLPFLNATAPSHQKASARGQSITLYAWNNNQWKKERTELIVPTDPAPGAQVIIQALLAWLAEEKIMQKKVIVEHVLMTSTQQELFVCFDKTLFSKAMSTHLKVMIIESILKTVRENEIKVPFIRFLVDHQPMQDVHIDFTHSWPLEGYSLQ